MIIFEDINGSEDADTEVMFSGGGSEDMVHSEESGDVSGCVHGT